MTYHKTIVKLVGFILLFLSCGSAGVQSPPGKLTITEEFKDYWLSGKAELTSYDLKQARYGEIHEGVAVLVFVTEDFSKKKQVKLDNLTEKADAAKVLKLNFTKKFNTGIYPYSIMQSVFTDVHSQRKTDSGSMPITYKTTTSSQEWCGITFSQLNLKGSKYEVQSHSYFESEGDQNFTLPSVYLEDEIWNLIRINPEKLPIGEVRMIPGLQSRRLLHRDLKPIVADIKVEIIGGQKVYTINYAQENRELTIRFNNEFPYQITGWSEKYQSGWGKSAKELTTTATLRRSINTDYWRKNSVRDSVYRKDLGLD